MSSTYLFGPVEYQGLELRPDDGAIVTRTRLTIQGGRRATSGERGQKTIHAFLESKVVLPNEEAI